MILQTRLAILLGSSGNLQGSHKFLCLWLGKKIIYLAWTKLPMPQSVIEMVNKMGKNERHHMPHFYGQRGSEDENDFNLEKQFEMGMHTDISEMKAELLGIDLQQGERDNGDTDEAYE